MGFELFMADLRESSQHGALRERCRGARYQACRIERSTFSGSDSQSFNCVGLRLRTLRNLFKRRGGALWVAYPIDCQFVFGREARHLGFPGPVALILVIAENNQPRF